MGNNERVAPANDTDDTLFMECLRWLDLLQDKTDPAFWGPQQKSLAKIYLSCHDLKERTWESELLESIMVQALERATREKLDPDAMPDFLTIGQTLAPEKQGGASRAFFQRVRKRAVDDMKKLVKEEATRKAAFFVACQFEKLVAQPTMEEKFILADVWKNCEHPGKAKQMYKAALFDRKPKAVAACCTMYTLFLCLLIMPDWRNSAFLLDSFFPEHVIRKFIKHKVAGLYPTGWAVPVDQAFDIPRALAAETKEEGIPAYGQDHLEYAVPFINYNFFVVEDGTASYVNQYGIIPLEDGTEHIYCGFGDRVKHLYLTGRLPVHDRVRHKATIVNTEKLWHTKTKEEQDAILDVFSLSMDKLNKLFDEGRDKILLTQDLYDIPGDGQITQEEQLEIYRQILKGYDHKRVIIKVHMQDKVEYEKYFPDCYIIREPFPVELLKFIGLEGRIDKLMAVTSTSLYGFFDMDKCVSYSDLLTKAQAKARAAKAASKADAGKKNMEGLFHAAQKAQE